MFTADRLVAASTIIPTLEPALFHIFAVKEGLSKAFIDVVMGAAKPSSQFWAATDVWFVRFYICLKVLGTIAARVEAA